MDFLLILKAVKDAYDLHQTISDLCVDKTALILESISDCEVQSAQKTLQDCKTSNDRSREIASAITQLRLAMEKTTSTKRKCQIAALIASCYQLLRDKALAMQYRDDCIMYFTSLTDNYLSDVRKYHRRSLQWFATKSYAAGCAVAAHVTFNKLLSDVAEFGISVTAAPVSPVEVCINTIPLLSIGAMLAAKAMGERPRDIAGRAEAATRQSQALFGDHLREIVVE